MKENKDQKFLDRIASGEPFIPLSTYELTEKEKTYISKMMEIRPLVVWLYAVQKDRIRLGNLLCATVYNKLGFDAGEPVTKSDVMLALEIPQMTDDEDIPEGETMEELEKRQKKEIQKFKLIKQIKTEYKKVTDGLVTLKKQIKALQVRNSKIITDSAELVLIEHFLNLEHSEKNAETVLKEKLQSFGPEADWLLKVPGVGPRLAGYLLSYLDPHRARHASCYISYCGFGVKDGVAMSRKKEHMIIRQYVNKKGEIAYKDSLVYADHMKSKLITCAKLNFLKKGNPYRKFYESSMLKDLNINHMDPVKQKSHIFKRALRIPIKQFLIDFWLFHRQCNGLPIDPPYEVAKLGMYDHRAG